MQFFIKFISRYVYLLQKIEQIRMDSKEPKKPPKVSTPKNYGKKPATKEVVFEITGMTLGEFIDVNNKYWEQQNNKKKMIAMIDYLSFLYLLFIIYHILLRPQKIFIVFDKFFFLI